MLVALILYKKSDTLKVSHKLNVAFSQRDWFLSLINGTKYNKCAYGLTVSSDTVRFSILYRLFLGCSG